MVLNLVPASKDVFNFDKYAVRFMTINPFMADISRNIRKIVTDDPRIPTAGVAYNEEKDELVLYLNNSFFTRLENSPDGKGHQRIYGLFTHELYHIIFGHIYDRKRNPPFAWNLGTDCAINSIIDMNSKNQSDSDRSIVAEELILPGRPSMIWDDEKKMYVLNPDKSEKAVKFNKLIESLPKDKFSEWYYGKFLEDMPELFSGGDGDEMEIDVDFDGEGQGGEGDKDGQGSGNGKKKVKVKFGQGDSHDFWSTIPEEKREYVENKIKSMIEGAVKRADSQANGWGNIPAHLQADIRRSVSKIIDWRAVLRQFVGNLYRGERSTSIKRINKRYPYIHPGVKRGYVAKLLVAIDMSGSVDDNMLEMFFAELGSLTKRVSITVLPFDCSADVSEAFEWKKGAKPVLTRTRMGGTDFNAPTQVFNDPKNRGRWDGMLIMTDGECSAPGPSRGKRGWVIGKGHKLLFETNETIVSLDEGRPVVGSWR